MKRTKLVGVGALTVLAMMLALLPAAGASAAPKLLVLQSGGVPVANGSPGDTGIEVDECSLFSNGKVGTNHAAKITLTETTASETECEAGRSISGLVKETALAKNGKATLKGEISVSEPGPCVYVFKTFKSTFEVPGFTFIKGTVVGKLNKKTSDKSCAKTTTQIFRANVTNEVFGEPFEAVLG
ncbi:MAG TPA: hypothetical protein VMB05_15065 [Solirubrobacteraceae bacterium]|nr:hypothetical protein [Solirubrobacteraceae bacterium]